MTFVDQRGGEILRRLPPGKVIGAEVGVYDGRLSKWLLKNRKDLTLLMVDWWQVAPEGHRYRQGGHSKAKDAQEQIDACFARCVQISERYAPRGKIIRAESIEAAGMVADSSLDFVFVDADHTYEAVASDIAAWWPKLKPGGLLCGHDWEHPDHLDDWGVKQAVEEFVSGKPLAIETGQNRTWFASHQ